MSVQHGNDKTKWAAILITVVLALITGVLYIADLRACTTQNGADIAVLKIQLAQQMRLLIQIDKRQALIGAKLGISFASRPEGEQGDK